MNPPRLNIILLVSVLLLLFSLPGWLKGQTHLVITTKDIPAREITRILPNERQKDSLTAIRELNSLLAGLFDKGYLGASVDSLFGNKDTLRAILHPGIRYEWMKLSNGNMDEGLLSVAGFRDKLYHEKPLRPGNLLKMNQKILGYLEDHGYPFASLRYDNFQFEEGLVAASLYLNAGKKITVDSVLVRGNSRFTKTYIHSYLSVKPGDLYNESIIRKIPNRIREMPMVTEIRPFSVAFTEETARVILNLDDKKASQIDGIIGVLPDNVNAGKVQITGDLRIRLLSSFGKGELFDLNWKQPAAKTQDFKVRLNYPFVLSSPFGVDLKLGIYKKDTSYLEVALGFGIQFLLKGGNYLKVYVDDKKSTLLSTKIYESATQLPPFADIRKTSYGIGLKTSRLDYRLNPRKGYNAEFIAGTGNRTIKKNAKLQPEIYDSLELKTVQYNGEGNFDIYFPLFSRNVINLGAMAGSLQGENTFSNELYRFGGLNSLRGFDEESISTSTYVMGKIELRYILEQNSYLFVFFNGAWYERNVRSEYINDTPVGFGAGITFETRLGIFSFNYALGRQFNDPVRIRSAKIHFGLVNYF